MPDRYKEKVDAIEKARKIYEIAKANGNNFPLIPAAQAVLESAWFKKESGKNNFFGQKATSKQAGRDVMTKEEINGKLLSMQQRFRDYDTLEDSIQDHLKKWQPVYNDTDSLNKALNRLAPKYATDSKYAEKVRSVIKSLQKRGIGTEYDYDSEQSDEETPQEVFGKDEFGQIVNVNPKAANFYSIDQSPTVKKEFETQQEEKFYSKEAEEAQQRLSFKDALVKGNINPFSKKVQQEEYSPVEPIESVEQPGYELGIPEQNEFLSYFLNPEMQRGGVYRDKEINDEIKRSNKEWGTNVTREEFDYYNPEKKEASSVYNDLNVLFNAPWLMDVPILGSYIKNEAKKQSLKQLYGPIANDNLILDDKDRNTAISKNREKTIEQYFSKEPLYPKSKYKPKSDYLEFLPSYSLKDEEEIKYFTNRMPFFVDFLINDLNDEKYSSLKEEYKNSSKEKLHKFNKDLDAWFATDTKDNKPEFPIGGDLSKIYDYVKKGDILSRTFDKSSRFDAALNQSLGGHKVGMAWDNERNLPYLSISDAWDFSPEHYSDKYKLPNVTNEQDQKYNDEIYVESYLMHKAGNPFKIYDRFYFDPETREYIPDSEIEKRKK